MDKKIKNEKAITLLALIVTLLVLLILAGVSIAMLAGENGLFSKSIDAKEKGKKAKEEELIELAVDAENINTRSMNVTAEGLEQELIKLGANVNIVKYRDGFVIKFLDTKRNYFTDDKGNVDKVIDRNKVPETEEEGEWTKLNKVARNGGYNSSKKVNAPKLGDNLTAVVLTTDISDYENNSSWYDYKEQISTTESGGTSKWANAVTTSDIDGSITGYYVWIPRYAYKITKGYHQNADEIDVENAGTIEVKFLKGATNELADGSGTAETDPSRITYTGDTQDQWLVHPAFLSDADIGGGFGSKSGNNDGVTGIWVAKFEMSAFIDYDDKETRNVSGRRALSGEMVLELMSLPEVQSAEGLNVGEAYKLSLQMNTNLKSHMLKNSEWGAVAYLAQSQYGRNGTEITINNAKFPEQSTFYNIYTGGSEGNGLYLDSSHVAQTTTGNAYGIYDLNGLRNEMVASYINNGSSAITSFIDYMGENTTESTQYKTVYPSTVSDGSSSSMLDDYNLCQEIKGDAIYETSNNNTGSNSWFTDLIDYPSGNNIFFLRGGDFNSGNNAGIFNYSKYQGWNYNGYAFRVAFVTD